jgi:hypothetical protein
MMMMMMTIIADAGAGSGDYQVGTYGVLWSCVLSSERENYGETAACGTG